MPIRYRQILPFVALALLLLPAFHLRARADRPEGPPPRRPYDAFPADLTAAAPPLPQLADGAFQRIEQHMVSLNAMWGDLFRRAGAEYEEPRVVQYASCAQPGEGWAGVYCQRTKTIVIDVDAHVRRHVGLGQGVSDQLLGYVVAHEVGHHVQTLRGADRELILKRELHAECLAGVWAKAAGIPLPPPWAFAEDPAHGTVADQIQWLNVGYRQARPADCDVIWGDVVP